MLIFYGDYKDLDNIRIYEDKGNPNPRCYDSAHVEYLFKYFEDFMNGKLDLRPTQKYKKLHESCVKIYIENINWGDGTGGTHYIILNESAGKTFDDARKYYDAWYVDKERNVLVCERQENHGEPFKSLQDLKNGEIRDCKVEFKKWSGIDYPSLDLTEEMWSDYLKEIVKEKKKWEAKTSQRWFHETEVSR